MIKMNFDNEPEDDDNDLIHLLKEELKQVPPDELAENTMTRIATIQEENKYKYKPLRIPLYLMAVIALLLLAPLLIPITTNGFLLDTIPEFPAYPEIMIIKYIVWCWLVLVTLWIVRILIPIQSRLS
jgi:hypothetical protein